MGKDINVPPGLDVVLKDFAKAALRSQPDDLIIFGKEYFAAQKLCDSEFGSEQATREDENRDLTMDLVWAIHRQFYDPDMEVAKQDLLIKWKYLRLDPATLDEILEMMGIEKDQEKILYGKFLMGACGFVTKDFLEVVKKLCELLSPDRKDGSNRILCEIFVSIYTLMLEMIYEDKEDEMKEWKSKPLDWLKEKYGEEGYEGSGKIGPDEFTHEDCPPLFPKKWIDDE